MRRWPGGFDGFVSVGGGSVIDTAKIANLYSTWPDDFMAYVYPPLGQGKPVPGPLKPHIAIPTTAGTGSETTGNAVFDLSSAHVKTAIAHRSLRPTHGHHRSGQHPDDAADGGGLLRARCALPRAGVVHRDPIQTARGGDRSAQAHGLPGCESAERCLGGAGDRARRRRTWSRAVQDPDDDEARDGDVPRIHDGRDRIRQCRGPPAARDVVSGVGPGPRLRAPKGTQPITRWCRTACR